MVFFEFGASVKIEHFLPFIFRASEWVLLTGVYKLGDFG